MKIYFKEYGWVRVDAITFIKALFICSWRGHKWIDLGDPCRCGSDNCFECSGCKYQSHD